MIKKEYNGWFNKQTWHINLTFEALFESMAEEQEFDDVEHMASAFEAIIDELEFESLKEGSLAQFAVGDLLGQVNWEEIAEHYFPGHVSEEDSERLQAMADRLAS